MSLNLNFSLIPPDPNSANAGAQVIDSKGVPIGAKGEDAGTVIAHQLGWASSDSIEPAVAEKINDIVSQYGNINLSIHVTGGANGDPITLYFNSADPSKPAPPINENYLVISQTAIAPKDGLHVTHNAKANVWFGGNAYVGFLECFMEMQRMLKQSKAVEGGIEIKMMNATVELAKAESTAIISAAEMQRDQYIASAVMAGVSVVIAGVSLGMTCRSIGRVQSGAFKDPPPVRYKNSPAKSADAAKSWESRKAAHDSKIQGGSGDPPKGGWSVNSENARISFWGSMGAFAQSLNQMGTNIASAVVAVPVAELEGLKTMLQTYKQMMQHILEKATDKFKQDTEQITQLISIIDSIRQKINEGLAGILRKQQ